MGSNLHLSTFRVTILAIEYGHHGFVLGSRDLRSVQTSEFVARSRANHLCGQASSPLPRSLVGNKIKRKLTSRHERVRMAALPVQLAHSLIPVVSQVRCAMRARLTRDSSCGSAISRSTIEGGRHRRPPFSSLVSSTPSPSFGHLLLEHSRLCSGTDCD
jgi:hypothetical protein